MEVVQYVSLHACDQVCGGCEIVRGCCWEVSFLLRMADGSVIAVEGITDHM
jgi:hypothetical protein